MALGQQAEARRTWQDLLAAHADDKSERIAEATFKIAETYGLPTPPNPESLNLGVAALENFLKKYPEHKLAGQAHLRIAQSYLNRGRHDDAVKALDRFLADKRYADREEMADARNLLGRAYQLQKKFPEALAAWREYLAKHPTHHDWSQVQQEIVNTEYLLGAEKAALKQYDEARKLWTEFLAKYPLDGRNPGIMFLFGQMNFSQEKWDDAIADWRRLVSKYPGTNEASQGQFMIARTLETKLGKLDEALKEYKKVNWGTGRAASHVGRQAADEQNAGDRHRARLPHQRNAEDQAHQPQHRHGHRPGLQGRSGNLLPQDARSARRGRARHFADRSRQDVRVQGAQVRRVPAAGKRDRSAAADEREGWQGADLRRDGRHRQQQNARSHDAGHAKRSGHHREKLARRSVRVRREHAHRQAVAQGAAADLQRPGRVRRRRRPATTACSRNRSRN